MVARLNLGVALEIPEPHCGELQQWREKLGDPLAGAIAPHVTLLPPTAVPGVGLAEVDAHLTAAAAGGRSFEVHLRGAGTFRPVSSVLYVVLVEGRTECTELEAAVRAGPLQRELRFPFHPHVTVAHDVPDEMLDQGEEQLASYEARFPVPGIALFEQERDGVWRPLRRFPFGSRTNG